MPLEKLTSILFEIILFTNSLNFSSKRLNVRIPTNIDLLVRNNNNGAKHALTAICISICQYQAIPSEIDIATIVSTIARTETSPRSAERGVDIQRQAIDKIPVCGAHTL